MKQLIKMSVAVLGVLCGSVSGVTEMSLTAPSWALNNTGTNMCTLNSPSVHQYDGIAPFANYAIKVNDANFLHNMVTRYHISGDSELYVTVLSLSMIRKAGNGNILFRPQYGFYNAWTEKAQRAQGNPALLNVHGEVDVSSNLNSALHIFSKENGVNYTCRVQNLNNFFSIHDVPAGQNPKLSPDIAGALAGNVNSGQSFAVVYQTKYGQIENQAPKNVAGVILVYNDKDMEHFKEAVEQGMPVGDTFLNAPIIMDHAQLRAIFM